MVSDIHAKIRKAVSANTAKFEKKEPVLILDPECIPELQKAIYSAIAKSLRFKEIPASALRKAEVVDSEGENVSISLADADEVLEPVDSPAKSSAIDAVDVDEVDADMTLDESPEEVVEAIEKSARRLLKALIRKADKVSVENTGEHIDADELEELEESVAEDLAEPDRVEEIADAVEEDDKPLAKSLRLHARAVRKFLKAESEVSPEGVTEEAVEPTDDLGGSAVDGAGLDAVDVTGDLGEEGEELVKDVPAADNPKYPLNEHDTEKDEVYKEIVKAAMESQAVSVEELISAKRGKTGSVHQPSSSGPNGYRPTTLGDGKNEAMPFHI